jgi:hypothetical protein
METFAPPHPTTNLSPNVYFQIVHTLTTLLPPPLDDSSGALHARNNTAIAKVASMYPVNANEADLAARSVVAGAQADDIMRLIRENAHDMTLTTRLHAQYASMARTSTAAQAMLIRVQAVRRKREAIKGATDEDAWTRHVVEQSMLRVADPETERVIATSLAAWRETAGAARREAAPADVPGEAPGGAHETQGIVGDVSEYYQNSHDMAFETRMSENLKDQPDETGQRSRVLEAMAEASLAARALPANGREAAPVAVPHAAAGAAVGETDEAAPVQVAGTAPHPTQAIGQNVSEYDQNSHHMTFETWISEYLKDQPDETGLRRRVLQAMAEARLAWQESSPDGRPCPDETG